MAVGNFLRQYMDSFANASEEAIIGTAIDSIGSFVSQSGMHTPEKVFRLWLFQPKLGLPQK